MPRLRRAGRPRRLVRSEYVSLECLGYVAQVGLALSPLSNNALFILDTLYFILYTIKVGLALSPLSNNALFLRLTKSPFYEFFSVGLNVSLSTDDPLMFHHTKEPLMEEYCVAKQIWRLSSTDLAEIARNSVFILYTLYFIPTSPRSRATR